MSRRSAADRRLQALERWRALELEEAQGERAQVEQAVARSRAAVSALERELEETREAARSLVHGTGALSVDELRRARDYGAWQARTLAERNVELEAQLTRAKLALDLVARRFADLSSVERLRERGARERAAADLRQDQKRLDDQALLRLGKADH